VYYNKNEIPYIAFPHLHSQYEIYYNISGAEGFMVSGRFYKLKNRDLIIVPKIQTHKVIVKENESYERCIINIDESVFSNIESFYNTCESTEWLKKENGMVSLSKNQHSEFMMLTDKYNEYKKSGNELMMLSYFLNIMNFLKISFENQKKPEYLSDENISYTDRVIRIVEKNFKDANVSDIAAKMYMNEDYLNRIFKEKTGITIKKYLTIRKLAEAKKHLYLKKSVREACILSGFNDYANFMRIFKKYEGYTPGELEELTEPI
jgi:AraC-like DNA-binding protein